MSTAHFLSPTASEGTTFTSFTGYQEPTWWRGGRSLRDPAARGGRRACGDDGCRRPGLLVTGLLPLVGVTLPLISYGGSSALTVMLALGLVSNFRDPLADKSPLWRQRRAHSPRLRDRSIRAGNQKRLPFTS